MLNNQHLYDISYLYQSIISNLFISEALFQPFNPDTSPNAHMTELFEAHTQPLIDTYKQWDIFH